MAATLTFSLIKPDAVQNKHVGEIIAMVEQAGFSIRATKLTRLTLEAASVLYEAHKDRSYYKSMCAFIASGPVVAMVLEKDNAVADFDCLKETIRKQFASSRESNAIHGAGTAEAASKEMKLLFPSMVCLADAYTKTRYAFTRNCFEVEQLLF